MKKGKLKITKVDSKDNSKTLEGAVFGIYNENNELVQEIVTNKDGIAISELLPYGKYHCRELGTGSEYYLLNEENFEFEVKNDGETIEKTYTNEPVTPEVDIEKEGTIETKPNEIPELLDIVVKHKVSNFGFARYCPNPEDFDLMASPEEYRTFLDKMWEKYMQNQECDTRFALKDHLWKLYLYEKGLFNPDEIDNPNDLILDGCHCGITHITTLADGTVYACRRSETPVGKVPEQSFYDIFNGEEMDKYRQYEKFKHCSKCEIKNFCRGCPSVAKCLTGNFYSKDSQCWKTF